MISIANSDYAKVKRLLSAFSNSDSVSPYRTPMEVIRIKIRDWQNLCDNIENGSIKIKKEL